MILVNEYGQLERSGDLSSSLSSALRAGLGRLGRFLADPDNFQGGHNHGLTEAAALLLIAERFPDFDASSEWRQIAIRRLAGMMNRTVDRDGVQIENSPYYQFYVLTFATEIAQWAERSGIALPRQFNEKIGKMLHYAALITLPNGRIPLLGASMSA